VRGCEDSDEVIESIVPDGRRTVKQQCAMQKFDFSEKSNFSVAVGI